MGQIEEVLFADLTDEKNARTWNNSLFLCDNFTSGFMPHYLDAPKPLKIRFATIVLCRAGSLSVKLNMQEYTLHADDGLLFAPGIIGEQITASDGCRILVIAFAESVYNIPAKNSVSMLLRNHFHREPVLIHFPHQYAETITVHYRLMRDVLADVSFSQTGEAVKSHINIISTYALHCIEADKEQQTERTRYERMFDQFLCDVKDYCDRERRVAFYADRLYISSKYLSKVVMDVSGRHPTDWIRDHVLLNAKTLLRASDYSVQQVSEMLHFPNPSFFGKYFREHMGCTPREYQNQK